MDRVSEACPCLAFMRLCGRWPAVIDSRIVAARSSAETIGGRVGTRLLRLAEMTAQVRSIEARQPTGHAWTVPVRGAGRRALTIAAYLPTSYQPMY